jgi:hypothetical protein
VYIPIQSILLYIRMLMVCTVLYIHFNLYISVWEIHKISVRFNYVVGVLPPHNDIDSKNKNRFNFGTGVNFQNILLQLFSFYLLRLIWFFIALHFTPKYFCPYHFPKTTILIFYPNQNIYFFIACCVLLCGHNPKKTFTKFDYITQNRYFKYMIQKKLIFY